MKRLVIIVASALIGLTANAQIFVGGSLGYTHNSATDGYIAGVYEKDRYSDGFNIGPEVGYRFNDKWSAGLKIAFAPSSAHASLDDEGNISKLGTWTNRWDVSLYGRYSVWGTNGFNVCLQGGLLGSLFYRRTSATYFNDPTDDEKSNLRGYDISVTFFPVLTYDVSRHVTLFSELNLLGVQYVMEHTSLENIAGMERDNYTETSTAHGFSLNINRRAEINLGVLYVF